MAKYNLIIRDSDYVLLVQRSQELGLSVGKLLNSIIHDALTIPFIQKEKVCFICGGKPFVEVRGFNGLYPLCLEHSNLRRYFKTFKEVE